MKARLAHLWDTFHSSFWFVPTNLSLVLAVLAAVVIRIDVAVDDRLVRQAPWLALMAIACERDIVIELLARPGTFLTKNLPLAKIWTKGPLADEVAKRISNTYITGKVRTPRQDVKYAVNELVEVALRALSPGVNDPFTAMTCIDRLGASVGRLAERQIPSAFPCDQDDKLRVIARPVTFSDLLNAAFNQIRQNARSNVSVIIRLLTALEAIAVQVRHEEDRKAVLLQAEMIRRGGEEAVDEANDRQPIQRQFERVKQVLEHRLDKDESVKDEGEVQEDKQPPTDKSLHPSPD